MSDPLTVLAGRLGILPRFQDQTGIWHDTTPETRAALITAMGFDPTRAQAELEQLRARENTRVLPDWLVCVADQAGPVLPHRWTLTTEDGAKTEGRGALPVLPFTNSRSQATPPGCFARPKPCPSRRDAGG